MRKSALGLIVLGSMLGLSAFAAPAQAQATRTWVSGVGDDANPCSRTAPCKTFAGAISKTAASGIINCIDAGGFGAVTITKSMTIDCKNVQAGILAPGTNAININGANIVVNLRGLSIEGNVSGLIGVNFIQGATLNIEHSLIFGFGSGTAQAVRIVPSSGASKVFISDTSIFANGTGIHIQPTGNAAVVASFNRVQINNNGNGVVANSTTSALLNLSMKDSLVAGNVTTGVSSTATGNIRLTLYSTEVMGNGTGISSTNANSLVLLHQSAVNGNGTGCATASGGLITSFSSNILSGNITTQCAPTLTTPQQ